VKKNVLITVKSIQTLDENKTDHIELTTKGMFYRKNDAFYIIYDESEITGMECTTTTLKIESRRVTLIRMGNINCRQVFVKNEQHTSSYKTHYGNLILTIFPKEVDINLTPRGGRIDLEYELEVGGHHISYNTLHIKVEEV
jgi:uncharacterized beta-barrel protein YwiB (DUF1934 family)